MKELSLQELKVIEFEMLKMFDGFCQENNIRYYLSHGTLLGAIRYGKFIPWDDDVDLLVPREDYNRMIEIFQDSEKYRLFAFEKDERYRFPFAKLCDMTTLKVEHGYDNGLNLGVDIDLFPLDEWNNNLKKAKNEVRKINLYMTGLSLSKIVNLDSVNSVRHLVKRIAIVICKIIGSRFFIRNIIKLSCKDNSTKCKYVGCKAWCVYGAKGIIPSEAFDEMIEIEFEGEMFPAPVGYDAYLRCLYGDYMPEPPKEKQKTHHIFAAYRL